MYALDTSEARKADTTGAMIREMGKYIGKFTQAENVTASTGTQGVVFSFTSDAGQRANISLYTLKSNGEKIMGFQTLMAILTCMSLRKIEPIDGKVKYWDRLANAEKVRDGSIFPELCNKPIGLLLETEDYVKNDGNTGTRMVLAGVFQAATELVATEILDKKTKPERLAQMVAGLRHHPAKAPRRAASPQQSQALATSGSGFDDMDDDIPF